MKKPIAPIKPIAKLGKLTPASAAAIRVKAGKAMGGKC